MLDEQSFGDGGLGAATSAARSDCLTEIIEPQLHHAEGFMRQVGACVLSSRRVL
jgi:hypothetical protein